MDKINSQINASHIPSEKTQSALEVFCLRFPEISGKIFKSIDDQSLADCKGINRTIVKFFDEERFYWISIIQKYRENLEEFLEAWKAVIHKTPIETVKELANSTQQFFKIHSTTYQKQWSPLHIAAERGLLGFCKFITKRETNPKNGNGITAFQMAANQGHLEICLFIMEKLENKNPRDNNGLTPLHQAARNGHLKVCRAIMETLENKCEILGRA